MSPSRFLWWEIAPGRRDPPMVLLMMPTIAPEMLRNPVFQRVLREGLAIQDSFIVEPVYVRAGKSYLKPTGVAELQKLKEAKRAKRS